MGYYADLIKQKQEKQNAKPFYTPGIPTKELKTRAEVERYMFEQRREVDKIIGWMESTKKKIQDIEKEPKPHDIGWADRLGRAKSSYKQYKRWMEMHEDFAARAEDWLDKNRNSKDNEKEEKDNSTVIRGTVHGHKYEVDRMSDGSYIGYVYDEEDFPIFKSGLHSTSSGAEQEIKSKVFNSKEEKENYEHPFEYLIKLAKQKGYPDLVKHLQEHKMEYLKDSSRIFARIKGLEGLPDKNNSDEKDNGRIEEMYREIQELKKKGLSSMDIDKYYAAINYRKTAEQYLAEFKKTKNTDYKYAAEGQLRKAEQLEREYKKHLHNSEEKGYYAKLAEEKAANKNSSSSLHRAINLILSYLQDGWSEDKIKRELKSQYNVTDEDIRDGFIAAKRLNKHI